MAKRLNELTTEVVPGRLELPTSTLSVWRSNQLSYRTVFKQRGFIAPSFFHSLSIEKQNREYKKHMDNQLPSLLLITTACSDPRPPDSGGEGRAFSPERRCSSRTFRYGYLVTT